MAYSPGIMDLDTNLASRRTFLKKMAASGVALSAMYVAPEISSATPQPAYAAITEPPEVAPAICYPVAQVRDWNVDGTTLTGTASMSSDFGYEGFGEAFIKWGDGEVHSFGTLTGPITFELNHTYTAPGRYQFQFLAHVPIPLCAGAGELSGLGVAFTIP